MTIVGMIFLASALIMTLVVGLFIIVYILVGVMINKLEDIGNRRKFKSGAVRDMQEGKGRCDLMPLDIIGEIFNGDECEKNVSKILNYIEDFKRDGDYKHLIKVLHLYFTFFYTDKYEFSLRLSMHFEYGAIKYGEDNWKKGIPVESFIDSAVRHLLEFQMGLVNEPHDVAFIWNIVCAIWTCRIFPELNKYGDE